ncbi:MAG TPA: 4-hydroxy-tetrahydrodipicolinate synthase [Rectinemataceae bacterium]|nr:4-hydroxy-tetrahydrodipicolinate synthase [Rectinemataceae bacterium]
MTADSALRGLGVAVATPFDANGRVDFQAFGRLLDFLAGSGKGPGAAGSKTTDSKAAGFGPAAPLSGSPAGTVEEFQAREGGGCDFLVVLGSTGEAATIEADERRAIIQFAVERAGGLPVVIGTGSNSTATCVRFTAEAAALGADAVLVVTPFYNKPTPDGLVAHFSAVAEAAANAATNAAGRVPVVVYNVPGRTGLNLIPSSLARLWKIPGILAVKESSGNLAQIGEIARTLPVGKILLSGDDALALPALAVGATGLISVAGNILPRRVKAMLDAAMAGRRQESIAIHQSLLPTMDALFLESNPIPLKAALALTGLAGDTLRLPLAPASAGTRTALARALSPFLEVRE